MKKDNFWKNRNVLITGVSGFVGSNLAKNLLENGAKNFMQSIYLGYMYQRWRKIRGLDKNDPVENKGQMQSSYKEFENKIK